MSRLSSPRQPVYPRCHLGHVTSHGPNVREGATAVWICEYPYRTIRLKGPDSDCDDCPVWRDMQRTRRRNDDRATDEIERLEAMTV